MTNTNNIARIAQFLQWIGEAEGDQVRIAAEAILSAQIQQDPDCQFDRLAIHAQAVADACGIRPERNETSDSISLIASMRDH